MRSKTGIAAFCLSSLLLAAPVVGQQAPLEEKGFRPEKLYSFSSLDHVNTFNGNLVLSIPIGMRHPLDGGFTYGLSLTYNSKVWDFDELDGYQKGSPSQRANAGLGWLLTMGRLVEPQDPTNPTNEWLYESPDGADHRFAADFLYAGTGCTGTYCGETWYTHDGSFLRMRELDSALRTVESGDGITSEFELVSGSWRLKRIHNAFKNGNNPLSYVNVTYPAPGGIGDCPGATSVWQLDDSKQRTHYVCLKDRLVDGDATPMIDRVVLAGVGGDAVYLFEYDPDQTIDQTCQDNYPDDPSAPLPKFKVPFLRRLKLSDGADELCSNEDCSRFQFDYFRTACPSGALQAVSLPTMGKISYTYEAKSIQANTPCDLKLVNTVGVSTRTLSDAVGVAIGTWTYKVERSLKGDPDDYEAYESCGTSQAGHPLHPPIYDEAVASVLDPAGSKFVQHYSTWPGNPGHEYDATSPDGFRKNDYSLPIGKFHHAVNANLSREILGGCASDGSGCTALRKTYVRYRLDPAHLPAENAHQTIEAERTEYLDDAINGTPRYAHVEHSEYDGFGHYRKAVTSGTFAGDNGRTTVTNFNPGTDLHGQLSNSSVLAISPDQPWVLGTYDSATVTDDLTDATTTSSYCFDTATGWLRAVRIGDQNSATDLVTVFTPQKIGGWSNGNVASETFYGGDGTPLNATAAAQTLCQIADGGNPGAIGYRIHHTYSYGQRSSSRYDGMPFLSLDRDILPTGLIQTVRDTDGVAVTSYDYFRDGRLKRIAPSGQAATDYVYTRASVSGSSFTPARVKATTTSTTAGTLETEYQFDALGRFWREKQWMPNETWSVREMLYDALNRKKSVSEPATLTGSNEFAFSPPHKTEFSNYDAFGRAWTIKAPDGKETTFKFTGESQKERTVGIATSLTGETSALTTEKYDRHGRLISVAEPGGVTTTYRYDVGDRLNMVQMGVQARTFDYDSRGFLRWESHPESGLTSYTYDARGHVLTKTHNAADSLFDLTYQYDAAERPVEIHARNPHYDSESPDPDQPQFRLMKTFIYGTENTTDDLRLGKLWTASRYNYAPHDADGIIYKISETWKYGDIAGRRTHRRTNITKGVGTNEAYWQSYRDVFTQMEYNDLNLPRLVTYPACVNCGTWDEPTRPSRSQDYEYTNGRLASVAGFVNSISYWPNGMWNTVERSNGVIDTQTIASGMARPASISSGPSDSCTVPAITSPPVGGTVTPSNPVLLSVSVSGTGPFTYKWQKEDETVVGTNATFTATTANTPVTTNYRVFVTNPCKTVESIPATVTVPAECIAPAVSATFKANTDGTYTLTATGSGTEPKTYTWHRTSDQASAGNGREVVVGPLSVTTTYTVTLANSCPGSPDTANVTIEIHPPMQAVLTAVRTPNENKVRLTWTGPTTGVAYTLQRRSGAAGWADLVTLSAAALSARAYDDNSVGGGKTYAYRLRNPSSQTSNADVATTATFSPVVAGARVTASSFDSVLAAVNSVRAAMGWPVVSWSNILSASNPLPVPGERIMSAHVMSARNRMNEALQALGVVVQPYTPGDVKGARVAASHVNDILGRAY